MLSAPKQFVLTVHRSAFALIFWEVVHSVRTVMLLRKLVATTITVPEVGLPQPEQSDRALRKRRERSLCIGLLVARLRWRPGAWSGVGHASARAFSWQGIQGYEMHRLLLTGFVMRTVLAASHCCLPIAHAESGKKLGIAMTYPFRFRNFC
jgi:hypothetical protein